MAKKGYSFGALVDFVESLQWKTNWAVPVGAILPFPKEPLPVGFLKLDGSKFDKDVYKDLFEFLGTDVLPNFTNLTPKMIGSDLAASQIKGWEVPQHNHTFSGTTDSKGSHKHTRGTMNITGKFGAQSQHSWEGAFAQESGMSWYGDNIHSNVPNRGNFDASRSWVGETSDSGPHTHTVSGTTANAGNSTKVEVDRIGVIYAIKAYGHVEEGYEVEFAKVMASVQNVRSELQEHREIGFDFVKILTTENLNDVTKTGLYHTSLSANATPENNYPVYLAGKLEVLGAHSTWTVYQKYTEYNNGKVYIRTRYEDVWREWQQQATLDEANKYKALEYVNCSKDPFGVNFITNIVANPSITECDAGTIHIVGSAYQSGIVDLTIDWYFYDGKFVSVFHKNNGTYVLKGVVLFVTDANFVGVHIPRHGYWHNYAAFARKQSTVDGYGANRVTNIFYGSIGTGTGSKLGFNCGSGIEYINTKTIALHTWYGWKNGRQPANGELVHIEMGLGYYGVQVADVYKITYGKSILNSDLFGMEISQDGSLWRIRGWGASATHDYGGLIMEAI